MFVILVDFVKIWKWDLSVQEVNAEIISQVQNKLKRQMIYIVFGIKLSGVYAYKVLISFLLLFPSFGDAPLRNEKHLWE